MKTFFRRFDVLRMNLLTRCVSRLQSTGTNVEISPRKKRHKSLDWIAPISSSHWREKVKMPSSSTSPILIENSNVAEPPVVNASPLIFLSRAGLIYLLQLVSSEIIVPEAVHAEIEVRGHSDPAAQTLANTSWLVVTQTPTVPPQIQAWGLGPGESAVLAWAHTHEGSEAIIDDLAGRRCAAAFNLPVRGTLGLVLTAKQRGHISSARQLLHQLHQAGMYLSDGVLNEALAKVGE